MIAYLQSLLPRLAQYSKKLDDTAAFVDIPWAFIDETNVKITYIFRRQGDILVSRQGEVSRGTWEYLPQIQSLLIQAQGKERIYNQGLLLDSAVMVLRKDGTDEIFALANPDKIPNMDVVAYLESFEAKRLHPDSPQAVGVKPRTFTTDKGFSIQLVPPKDAKYFVYINSSVVMTDTNMPVSDGKYQINDNGKVVLEVKNGKVIGYMDELNSIMTTLIYVGLVIAGLVLLWVFQN